MNNMHRVKVTRNYQVTIPAEIRRALGINEGDVLEIFVRDEEIIMRRISKKRKTIRLGKKLDVETIERSIEAGAIECVQS